MRLRQGTDSDVAAAAAVVARVLDEHDLPFDPAGLDADIVRPSAAYRGGAFFVAEDAAGRVVGTAALAVDGNGDGEVRKLFVLPEARGRGVGRRLLWAVLDAAAAQGLDRVRLTTRAPYGAAMRLYEASGFRFSGPAGPERGGEPGLGYEIDLVGPLVRDVA